MSYWGYLIGYGYLAMLLGIAELFSRLTRVNREVMRKVLHCLIGFEWLVLYYCFAESWQIVIIPASFIVVNLASYRFKLFRSVERDEGNHWGTVFYAVSMTAMSIATAIDHSLMLPFGVAVACLSFGDAAAALMGQYLKPRIEIFSKSLWGVVGCFLFSLLGQLGLFALLGQQFNFNYIVAIAVVAALSEVITNKGTDNLFVCLWCFLWTYALYLNTSAIQIVLMCYVGFVLACVSINVRAFTVIGSCLAGGMLAAVGLLCGWFPFLFILAAYGIIYLAEHFIKKSKFKETRRLSQIIQNGLCAFAVVIAYYFTQRAFLLIVYVVAITESLADSFAGVMGNAYAKTVNDIINRRPIEKGLSGGVSLIGTLSAFFVCVIPTVVCGIVFGWHWYLLAVALLPFLGTILDSILGATVQYKQRCTVCGKVCECTVHCGRPTVRHSGYPIFTNGNVNLLSNVATTIVAAIVLYFAYGF